MRKISALCIGSHSIVAAKIARGGAVRLGARCRRSPCRCAPAWRRRRSLPRSRPTFPSIRCRAESLRRRAERATRRARRTSAPVSPLCGGSVMRPRSSSRGSCRIARASSATSAAARAALVRLAALIDLDQHVERRRERGALLVQAFRDSQTIHGVDPVESLRDLTRLVRLQLADEVPRYGEACESVHLRQRFLHVAFAEVREPRAMSGHDRRRGLLLADSDDRHATRGATGRAPLHALRARRFLPNGP